MSLTAPSPARVRLARTIALAADFFQVIAFPLFFPGGLSPLVDALDIGVAIVMTMLLGWHWAFLPTMFAELLPILDLFPTWTMAVFYVTRGQAREPEEPQAPRIKDITPPKGAEGAAPSVASADAAPVPRTAPAPTARDPE